MIENTKKYLYPSEKKHYSNFVSEQKRLIQNPHLLPGATDIHVRIQNVQEASQKIEKEDAVKQLSLIAINYVGGLFGPIGAGVTALLTSKSRRVKPIKDIYKASQCGGVRMVKKVKNRKGKGNNNQFSIDRHSVVDGIKASLYSLLQPKAYLIAGISYAAFSLYGYFGY